jgi:signal transduction histidine kinase
MNNVFPKKQDVTEYTLEERALILRLRMWVNLRWLVVFGIIIATLVASKVFNIGFPTIPVYITCAVIAFYNLFLFRQTQSLKTEKAGAVVRKAEIYGYIQILLDLVALTVLIHFTGGIENPFIFFYLVHTTVAGIVLPKRRAYELATFAILMCSLLLFLEYADVIPHVNLEGFVLPSRYKQLSRFLGVLFALAALVYTCTYVTTVIWGELRKRQQQVVRLRDQLLETRTRELEQISSEVAKLEEERSRFVKFLGVVAHDLQSPLVATQSIMSYILDGYTGEITEGQKDLLDRGMRRIDGLLTLITDLLDIPRIETGQITREMKEISLNEVLKSAVDGLDNVSKQKGIELKVELPQSPLKIYGSSRRLQQVITNLVSNAISYTSEGMVLIRLTDGDKEVRVEVIDSGIGISPDDLPQLFDDFFRGSKVVGTKGTGLGLSISKRIIEAHGGTIWAESPCPETNKGSKFTFILPKQRTMVQQEIRE